MKKNILLIILGTILVSCNNEIQNNEQIEVIDLTSSSKKKFSELFSSYEIIQLETNSSSLVGLSISKAEIYKGKMYFLNLLSSRKNILCFDSIGNFSFVIDRLGSGPEEYTYLQDFFIDKNRNEMILICIPYKDIMYLDLDGNFIKTKARPDESYINQMFPINDSIYMGYSMITQAPIDFNLIQYDANSFEIIQKTDKMKEYVPFLGNFPLTYYNNSAYYYDNMSDTIYDVTDVNFAEALYYVNSGKDTQDAKKQFKAIALKDPSLFFNKSFEILYDKDMICVYSYYINNNWVALNVDKPKERYKREKGVKKYIVFYNKKKQESYSSENIIFDIFNLKEALPELKIAANCDDYFYLLINYEFTEEQKNLIKQSKLTEKEKAILINHTEEDNPIIMKIKT